MIHPSNVMATGIAIIIAVIVYFVMVFKTKAVTRDELSLLPKGDKIYNLAERLHLTK
jgi:stage V sporulation protein B